MAPLTEHQKDYIRDHHKNETVNKMSRETGLPVGRIKEYCELRGYSLPCTKTLMKLAKRKPVIKEQISTEIFKGENVYRGRAKDEYSNKTPFGIA